MSLAQAIRDLRFLLRICCGVGPGHSGVLGLSQSLAHDITLPSRDTQTTSNNQHLNTRHPATPTELQTEVPSQPRLSLEAVSAAGPRGPDIRTLEPMHVDPLKFCDTRTSESIGSILVSGFLAPE